MFMVTQILLFIFELFPYAEFAEDGVEDVVVGDAACDFAQRVGGSANILGQQFTRNIISHRPFCGVYMGQGVVQCCGVAHI